jgi:hypothetical protein
MFGSRRDISDVYPVPLPIESVISVGNVFVDGIVGETIQRVVTSRVFVPTNLDGS